MNDCTSLSPRGNPRSGWIYRTSILQTHKRKPPANSQVFNPFNVITAIWPQFQKGKNKKKRSHKFSVLRIRVNLCSSRWLTFFKLRPSDHQWRSRLKGRTRSVGQSGAKQECFFWAWSCATWPAPKETALHAPHLLQRKELYVHTHTGSMQCTRTSCSSRGGNAELGPCFRTRGTHTNIQNWADSFSNIPEENRKTEITLCWQTLIFSFLFFFFFG